MRTISFHFHGDLPETFEDYLVDEVSDFINRALNTHRLIIDVDISAVTEEDEE